MQSKCKVLDQPDVKDTLHKLHANISLPADCWEGYQIRSDHLSDYLDLTFIIGSGGKLLTRLYNKCDDFGFHIVNFPFLSSSIPSGPSCYVYILQLIRYACCSHYDDFRYRHKCLVDRLLSWGYIVLRLKKSLKKFMENIRISLRNSRDW